MKKAILVFILGAACLWSACGGGGSSNKPKSGLTNRAFVTNYYAGTMAVLNAQNDTVSSSTETVGANPTTIYSSPDGNTSLIYNSGSNSLSVINNATEAVNYTIAFSQATDSIALAGDNKMGFAAERNVTLTGYPAGAIQAFDYYDNSVATYIPVPDARYVAVDHSGKHLLVFSDLACSFTNPSDTTNCGSGTSNWYAYWVDLTNVDYTQSIQNLGKQLSGILLNRPVAAFFSSDDNTAYIIECGTECSGNRPARVTKLSTPTSGNVAVISTTPAQTSGSANEWGARAGLLYNSTLWVTGSPQGSGGTAVSIDLNSMTPGTPFTACASGATSGCMSDGTKVLMRQLNNKIFIGSKNCTTSSCLTVVDPNANTATLGKPATSVSPNLGDVTGATYLPTRNMYYLIEGGQVYLYDANYNQVLVQNFDVTGALYDVVYVPPPSN